METAKIVENVAFNILKQAVIYLPEDVKQALKKAYAEETSETGICLFQCLFNVYRQ